MAVKSVCSISPSILVFMLCEYSPPHCHPVITLEINEGAPKKLVGGREGGGREGRKREGRRREGGKREGRRKEEGEGGGRDGRKDGQSDGRRV